jgi:magnesium chelatase family protein
MSLALIHARALDGLHAPAVQVEVHLANGLPSFTLVGLADTEVKEARERVRAALLQSGLSFPHNKRVTVNLAPADLPKESGRFDLPIALGVLAAQGELDPQRLAACEFAGELSLTGELRPVRGALALALAVSQAPDGQRRTLVLPPQSAAEAARITSLDVRVAGHLRDVVAAMRAGDRGVPLPRAQGPVATQSHPGPDLADVRGQSLARRALEVAAAGGHSVLLVGPPGSGKSMLAQRLPGLLPPMSEAEALASAAIQGLVGAHLEPAAWQHRPLRAPHHSASAVALVGGGSPPRPGEISLAHAGVLFLDELPEFQRAALEALREPLESGAVTISRAGRQARFPAAFQLVAAMNPCPCGWLGGSSWGRHCRCTPDAVRRYQARLSGPLLDRIDMQVEVPAVPPEELLSGRVQESSGEVAQRVAAARARQWTRQQSTNAALAAGQVDLHCSLTPAARTFVQAAAQRLGWSGRSLHRVLKLARTIADLADVATVDVAQLAEAIQYRRALPESPA